MKIDELQRKHAKQTSSVRHFFATSSYQRPTNENVGNPADNVGNSKEPEVPAGADAMAVEDESVLPAGNSGKTCL